MSFPQLLVGAPLAGKESSSDMAGMVSCRSGRPIRLLLVDDDSRVRQAIALTITLEPDLVIVAEAADAMTALAVAEGTAPSVALVDVLLPDEVTGLALLGGLARRRGCAVVAMSVRGGLRHAALAVGAIAFVEKSGDIDALLGAVRVAAASPPSEPRALDAS